MNEVVVVVVYLRDQIDAHESARNGNESSLMHLVSCQMSSSWFRDTRPTVTIKTETKTKTRDAPDIRFWFVV